MMRAVIGSLQRITYDGDPVQLVLQSTTYQPFISFFNQTEITNEDPDIFGIRKSTPPRTWFHLVLMTVPATTNSGFRIRDCY